MLPRTLLMLIWGLIATSVAVGVHAYLWMRLIRDAQLPPPWRLGATIALVASGATVPLAMVLGRLLGVAAAPVVWAGFVWMGLVFFLLVVLAGGDALRALATAWVKVTDGHVDPARRVFFARAVSGSAVTAALLLGSTAARAAMRGPEVKRVAVRLSRWPERYNGAKVVQISDLHVGPTIGRQLVEEIVIRTNALNPDLVVLTGDLVDGSVAELKDAVAPLGELRARFGVYAVTGNHEYYSGADEWIAYLGTLGIKTLRNERVTLGEGDALFELAGVDDATAHRYLPHHGSDIQRACSGANPERELILLAHQPKAVLEAEAYQVGLVLSGHTHGGQIWPFGYLVALTQPYMRGLYRHSEATQIYVSCGTGYWGPPMRLGAPAELTCLELSRA